MKLELSIPPQKALVTPRVHGPAGGEVLPLEHFIRRLLDERPNGLICLCGPPGAGKSTALAHLAASLPPGAPLRLLDRPLAGADAVSPGALTIYTSHTPPSGDAAFFQMVCWTRDDLVEYLLATHRARCRSVMSRVLALSDGGALLSGSPELWRAVLDSMAADDSISTVAVALRRVLGPLLSDPVLRPGRDSFALLLGGTPQEPLQSDIAPRRLLRHRAVQVLLAADWLVERLCAGEGWDAFGVAFPEDLVVELARLAANWPAAIQQLEAMTSGQEAVHAMAASTLVAADPRWTPRGTPMRLTGAFLAGVSWQGINLGRSDLSAADLSGSDLTEALLDEARLGSANFRNARLSRASMHRALAPRADFSSADLSLMVAHALQAENSSFDRCNLSRANLVNAVLRGSSFCHANFVEATLTGADLTAADVDRADFTRADLRKCQLAEMDLNKASLDEARLNRAIMKRCNLSGATICAATFVSADLYEADMTASVMHKANFFGADLKRTLLANIDWEGADLRSVDLRGACFHMGSTRSGLVGSPIACEGSRTGFYTDDFDEQEFRRPEEIRKANLCEVDLRGAQIEDVDFYLVDLRGAQLDPEQFDHLRRCRAILSSSSDGDR